MVAPTDEGSDPREPPLFTFTLVDGAWSCSWHQDRTHEELRPAHVQIDRCEWCANVGSTVPTVYMRRDYTDT